MVNNEKLKDALQLLCMGLLCSDVSKPSYDAATHVIEMLNSLPSSPAGSPKPSMQTAACPASAQPERRVGLDGISRYSFAGCNEKTTLSVSLDMKAIEAQLALLPHLLERLPDGVSDSLRRRFADLADFGIQTEVLPATDAGRFSIRFRSVALDELCIAALRAANSDRA